jgi:hypothetical protein
MASGGCRPRCVLRPCQHMALSEMRGFVAQANAEIRAADAAHQCRKAERQRLRRPIALIDELINDLEVLNLRGTMRVPLSYEPRVLQIRALLREAVSEDQLDALRTRVRPDKLMDTLYTLEETLFAQLRTDRVEDVLQVPGLYPAA